MKILITSFCILFWFAFASTIQAQCTADFDTTSSGLTVNFSNQSTGGYNYVEYDFGDGNFSVNVNNPSHTYAEAGVYPVCIYILDTISFQCFSEYCDTLFMGGATCGAFFDLEFDGLDADFYSEAIGSYDSLWFDFGDGSGSSNPDPSHSYSTEGTYTICLSLFDNGTMCDSSCYSVFFTDEECEADFSYNTNGLDVDFTDASTGGYDAVYWDFGDGFGDSEDFDPSYTYFAAGTYEVCLFIYNINGGSCEEEYCEFVTVTGGGGGGGGCDADYSYVADQLSIAFINESSGGLFSTWDFGDGSTPAFEENPTHVFATPGTYEVCVTVLNPFPFCTDTYCEFVDAKEYNCEPMFTYTSTATNTFTFVNTTEIGNVTSVLWSFGDGNTSAFTQPTYTYNVPGTYNVCLTTFDEGSECGKTCEDINVYPVGIEELSAEDFQILPNPNNGSFRLLLSEDAMASKFTVLDLSGRVIYSMSNAKGKSQVDFALDLPAGAYFIQAEDESSSRQITLKMLVQ